VLLKVFQYEGRFPACPADVPGTIVAHLAQQTGVPPDAYYDGEWSERTQRHQRAQIRAHGAFRLFRPEDDAVLVACLSERVMSPHPEAEALKNAAYDYVRTQHLEPPAPERVQRLLRAAVAQREQQLITHVMTHLGLETRAALDALVHTQAPKDTADVDQILLCPVRSALAAVKDAAGAVSVETVLDEIAKLKQLRALGLPESLFRDVPPTLLPPYRQRAASEPPRELRRHPPEMRYLLLAALCWQRQRAITDTLVDLLIHIAHRVSVRAEEKGNSELRRYAKQVIGKAKLLYKLAKAAKGQPDGVVRAVIYPAVDEQTLEEIIQKAEATAQHAHQVPRVTRVSCGISRKSICAQRFRRCAMPFSASAIQPYGARARRPARRTRRSSGPGTRI